MKMSGSHRGGGDVGGRSFVSCRIGSGRIGRGACTIRLCRRLELELDSTRLDSTSTRVVSSPSHLEHTTPGHHSFIHSCLSFISAGVEAGRGGAQGLEYTISWCSYTLQYDSRGGHARGYKIKHRERHHIVMVLSHLHYAWSPPYARPETSTSMSRSLDSMTRLESTTRRRRRGTPSRLISARDPSWVDACDDTRGR